MAMCPDYNEESEKKKQNQQQPWEWAKMFTNNLRELYRKYTLENLL